MLELAVAQIETELQWLTKVNRELPGQPPGTRPAYDLHRTKNKSNVE